MNTLVIILTVITLVLCGVDIYYNIKDKTDKHNKK